MAAPLSNEETTMGEARGKWRAGGKGDGNFAWNSAIGGLPRAVGVGLIDRLAKQIWIRDGHLFGKRAALTGSHDSGRKALSERLLWLRKMII